MNVKKNATIVIKNVVNIFLINIQSIYVKNLMVVNINAFYVVKNVHLKTTNMIPLKNLFKYFK
jgi:hypothetical protein